ncbi:MAG: hypothetical protein ABIZ95_21080 [Pyrinomonadaceae bacterium]
MQYANANATSTTIDPAVISFAPDQPKWWELENQSAAAKAKLFRVSAHELEFAMMSRPLPVRRVYELLGLMLGAVPPAMIFAKLFGYGLVNNYGFGSGLGAGLFFLCLMMNLVCVMVGFLMGRAFSRAAMIAERSSRSQMVIVLALLGLAWGIITGLAGGIFFFGFGAIAGIVFAVPIGVVSFLVFGTLHRWLERGEMIETRHFLPVAIGLTATISMLIGAW